MNTNKTLIIVSLIFFLICGTVLAECKIPVCRHKSMALPMKENQMFTTDIDNGYDEVEIEIDYDYEPFEPKTRHYPGCSENIIIIEIRMTENNSEIFIIDKKVTDLLEEQILNYIHEEQAFVGYGYMMDLDLD